MADLVYNDPEVVKNYVEFRPVPPEKLITTVVDFVKEKRPVPLQVCVDVGCGSGQSTGPYSSHFQHVIGVDVSREQLKAARKTCLHNVVYKEGSAESLPVETRSVDLVTSCMALHWFNFEEFYAEVERVLYPGGVLACYSYFRCIPIFGDRVPDQTFNEIWSGLKQYWPPGIEHMVSEYTSLPDFYPEEVVVRSSEGKFSVEMDATLDTFLGYISSFATFTKFRQAEGEEAAAHFLSKCKQKLQDAMGTKEENVPMKRRYNYFLKMWRKPSD